MKYTCWDCETEHTTGCPNSPVDANSVLVDMLPCPWCGVAPNMTKEFGVYKIECGCKGFCPVQPKLVGRWVEANNAIREWNKRKEC